MVYKGGFDSKLRPAEEVAQKLERYEAELIRTSPNQHATPSDTMVPEDVAEPAGIINGISSSVVLNPVPLNLTPTPPIATTEMVKIELATVPSQPNTQPKVVRLPNNIIRTKPRENQVEVAQQPLIPKPNVILVDDEEKDLIECQKNAMENFWGSATPNPEVITAPNISAEPAPNPEEIFGKIHDQKATSFKAAADYLLVNSYHTELQMTVSPFSFETAEYFYPLSSEFKKLVSALTRLKDLRVYSLTIK